MPQDKPPASVDRYRHEEFVVALPYADAVTARVRRDFQLTCVAEHSRKQNGETKPAPSSRGSTQSRAAKPQR